MPYIGRNRIRIVLLLSCLLLTACVRGSNTETPKDRGPANGNDQKGYLYADADSVLFLQWTEINGKLIGQMNVFFAKGSRDRRMWLKLHLMVGTKTNIVTSVEVSDGYAHDYPFFKGLVDKTAESGFQMRKIVIQSVHELGIETNFEAGIART